ELLFDLGTAKPTVQPRVEHPTRETTSRVGSSESGQSPRRSRALRRALARQCREPSARDMCTPSALRAHAPFAGRCREPPARAPSALRAEARFACRLRTKARVAYCFTVGMNCISSSGVSARRQKARPEMLRHL